MTTVPPDGHPSKETRGMSTPPTPRPRVDHTYRDYSRYLQEGGPVLRRKKCDANFPAKLHRLLSDPRFERVIAWMPHGRAWKILDKKALLSEAIPSAGLGQTKFESFTRQLNCWGFKRLHRPGPDCGCYYHECFLRGLPKLTGLMERNPINPTRPVPDAASEPNLYRMSEVRPLPPSGPRENAAAALVPSALVHPPVTMSGGRRVSHDSNSTMPPPGREANQNEGVPSSSKARAAAVASPCASASSVFAHHRTNPGQNTLPTSPATSFSRRMNVTPATQDARAMTYVNAYNANAMNGMAYVRTDYPLTPCKSDAMQALTARIQASPGSLAPPVLSAAKPMPPVPYLSTYKTNVEDRSHSERSMASPTNSMSHTMPPPTTSSMDALQRNVSQGSASCTASYSSSSTQYSKQCSQGSSAASSIASVQQRQQRHDREEEARYAKKGSQGSAASQASTGGTNEDMGSFINFLLT